MLGSSTRFCNPALVVPYLIEIMSKKDRTKKGIKIENVQICWVKLCFSYRIKGTPRVSINSPRDPEQVELSQTKILLLPENLQNQKENIDNMPKTHRANIFLLIPIFVSAATVALSYNRHHLPSKPVLVNALVSFIEDSHIILDTLKERKCQNCNLLSLHENCVPQIHIWACIQIAHKLIHPDQIEKEQYTCKQILNWFS